MAQSNSVTSPASDFDIIIIGGGIIGLSAAYYAAARGLKTLLLEQHKELADDCASSGGYSRMFRIMYSPDYMAKLAEIALALWHEIETASRIKILKPQPLLFYGVSEQTPEGDLGEMKRILDNLGAPYRWYDSNAALAAAFRVFKEVPKNYVGLEQPNSAVIRTKRSVEAFARLAKKAGAILLKGQQATVTRTSGPYEVTCPARTYTASRLILAPSAWTNNVLQPFGIQLNLCIWQMTLAYFPAQVNRFHYPLWYEFGPTKSTAKLSPRLSRTRISSADWASFDTPCPASTTTQDLFYGFPSDEHPGYIKVSADFTYNFYADPGLCTHTPDKKILLQLGKFLRRRFRNVSPTPTRAASCLYTMSSDYQMVLDRLPGYPNVAIFTGDSGRGFKFAPLFGRALVDLATNSCTYYDISPFSINRPGIIKP